ncbi:hypothetical protein DL764_000329 [Monosporascus ibericus]|uniref:Uncharacterized protein n=1 Tax=Monosporascus ibericus TaxID=155417 RepID=A0A4Q4TZ06_9PEZI|nr:hypothetical protein DL764_000329 [Monosporascus ibericus]
MDDSKDPFVQISKDHQRPIISLLLDISRYPAPLECFLPTVLRHLECLYVDPGDALGTTLLRTNIDAFVNREYVAISYAWRHPGQIERNGRYSLTFNKRCRFVDVTLTEAGILTKGYLWKLGRIVDTAKFEVRLPFIKDPNRKLGLWEQRRLAQLSRELRNFSETTLASQLENYLTEDAAGNKLSSFEEDYRLTMAREIARAIKEGQTLRLGSSWDLEGGSFQCTAIFLWDNDRPMGLDKAAFAFTSLQPKKTGFAGHDAVDTDRHASLEVEMRIATGQNEACVPHFYKMY